MMNTDSWPLCDNCGGKGVVGGCRESCDHIHTFMFCPSCVGGRTIPADIVDAAAKAYQHAWERWWENGRGLEKTNPGEETRIVMAAALLAAFRAMEVGR